MKTIKFAALAAGLALAGSANAATNLIINGSFESGGLTGWVYAGSGADVGPGQHPATIITYNNNLPYPNGAFGELVTPDNSPSASPDAVGTHAAYFVADASHETLTQSVFLDVGQYTIGFSAYMPLNGFNNSGNATFNAKIAGVNLANFDVDGNVAQQWRHFAGVANILVAGNYITEFTYDSGPAPAGDFVIDRAYIVAGNAVPEPGTWALMILGFGGAGAMLRSNRRRVVAA
jgi:hypothetical protein